MSRKIYQLLAFIITPITVFAQPVLNNVEEYNTNGMVIKRVVCEPVVPGPGGANQIWDFSILTETGDSINQQVMPAIPGNPFPSANLAFHSDEIYVHFQQTSTESLQWGMVDSSGNEEDINYSDPMLVIRRPLAYEDTATDVFSYTTIYGGTFPVEANGDMSLVADGYGTIYLPHDTFDNVVRIRVEHNELDSADGLGTLIIHNVYYVWYSNEFASPVFRVDSITLSGMASAELVDVQYLAQETEVTSTPYLTSPRKVQVSGHLSSTSLMLHGSFETGKHYEIGLFGANGQLIMKRSFVGSGQNMEMAMDQQVASGTYILTVRQKGEMSSMSVIKLVKQ